VTIGIAAHQRTAGKKEIGRGRKGENISREEDTLCVSISEGRTPVGGKRTVSYEGGKVGRVSYEIKTK